jgi:nucleoside-diphosphate-sugar epimerase
MIGSQLSLNKSSPSGNLLLFKISSKITTQKNGDSITMALSSGTGRAFVVGGTSGIGSGIALALAKRRYEVTIGGRSESKAKSVLAQLPATDDQQHRFVAMDGFDLQSIKEATDKVGDIDVLVMTQASAWTRCVEYFAAS